MTLLIGLLILILYATGFILCVSEVMFQGELEVSKFLLLNAGLFLMEFFLAQMLSQVDEKVEFAAVGSNTFRCTFPGFKIKW